MRQAVEGLEGRGLGDWRNGGTIGARGVKIFRKKRLTFPYLYRFAPDHHREDFRVENQQRRFNDVTTAVVGGRERQDREVTGRRKPDTCSRHRSYPLIPWIRSARIWFVCVQRRYYMEYTRKFLLWDLLEATCMTCSPTK